MPQFGPMIQNAASFKQTVCVSLIRMRRDVPCVKNSLMGSAMEGFTGKTANVDILHEIGIERRLHS